MDVSEGFIVSAITTGIDLAATGSLELLLLLLLMVAVVVAVEVVL